MTTEKFTSEAKLLKQFFEFYCRNKHTGLTTHTKEINYNNEKIHLELELCPDCLSLIEYSLERLSQCPYDSKPRCRNCPDPCYDKEEWKKVAKIMKYSGIRLGFIKLKKMIFK